MEGTKDSANSRVLVTVEQAVEFKEFHSGLIADLIRKRCALMADQVRLLSVDLHELPEDTCALVTSVLGLLDAHREKFDELALYLTTAHHAS